MGKEITDQIYKIIKERRSIRSFTTQDVPDEIVQKIIEAGWLAPSAGNRQPVEYIIIRDEAVKQKISVQKFVGTSSVVVVVAVNKDRATERYGERGEKMYIYHDSGAAIQNMLLMAKTLDIGTCWIGAFNDERVSKLLKLPDNIMPMAIIPMGYPESEPSPPRKIPLEKIVHNEQYEPQKIKEYLMSLVD